MKRLMSLGLMLLMLSTLLVFTTSQAHAAAAHAAAGCYNTSCDDQNPISTGCVNSAATELANTSGDLGGGLTATISLRFSYGCQSAWALIVFNKPVPSCCVGDATIVRDTDGKTRDCGDWGGNGVVWDGQTSCYTPMLGDEGTTTSHAVGWYIFSDNGPWHEIISTTSW